MELQTKTIYSFDAEGFFCEEVLFQVGEGIFKPEDCTETEPPKADPRENWFKWDGEAWNVVPKPKTAAELVGLTVSHQSRTPHDLELKGLMLALCTSDSGHRVKRGSDLSWSVEKIPDQTLEDLKTVKKAALENAFLQWYEADAIVTSSLGFVADSDERAVTDVSGLIKVAEATPEESRQTTIFMDHDNQAHPLTLEELKLLQLEILQNGQYAYQQKWTLRSAIEAAENEEALSNLEIAFVGLDFSKEAATL